VADGNGADPFHQIQAAAEGVTLVSHVEFKGRQYRLGPQTGEDSALAPMLEFAHAAQAGIGSQDPGALDAMFEMIRGVFVQHPACGACEACDADQFDVCPQFDPGDFPRFWRVAKATAASAEDLLGVVQQAIEQATARPTPPPSGSSAPGRPASASSKDPFLQQDLPEAFRKLPPGDLVSVDSFLR
jgi:hypothetical protein